MKSQLFKLVGIQQPGRVNLYRFGTVNLAEVDDDLLLSIYKAGNTHYLMPTEAGMKALYPETKIEVKQNPVQPPGRKTGSSRQKHKSDK